MATRAETTMDQRWLDIGPVRNEELDEVAAVCARGMRDNPVHVAVFGDDPDQRQQQIQRLFARAAHTLGWDTQMVVARDTEGVIVGACGVMAPGCCQPKPAQRIRLLPVMLETAPEPPCG